MLPEELVPPVILPNEVFEEERIEAYNKHKNQIIKEIIEWAGNGVPKVSSVFWSGCGCINENIDDGWIAFFIRIVH